MDVGYTSEEIHLRVKRINIAGRKLDVLSKFFLNSLGTVGFRYAWLFLEDRYT